MCWEKDNARERKLNEHGEGLQEISNGLRFW